MNGLLFPQQDLLNNYVLKLQLLTTDRYLCAPLKFFNSRRHALKLYLVTSSAQTLAASCLFVTGWTAVTNTYGAVAKDWRKKKRG